MPAEAGMYSWGLRMRGDEQRRLRRCSKGGRAGRARQPQRGTGTGNDGRTAKIGHRDERRSEGMGVDHWVGTGVHKRRQAKQLLAGQVGRDRRGEPHQKFRLLAIRVPALLNMPDFVGGIAPEV